MTDRTVSSADDAESENESKGVGDGLPKAESDAVGDDESKAESDDAGDAGTDPESTRESDGTDHLDDIDDGVGCTEIWEHLSERREAGRDA